MEHLERGIVLLCLTSGLVLSDRDLTQEPGHLKPFGSGRPTQEIQQVQGFPDQKVFMREHFLASVPLKMAGAAKLSPGFTKWTDDYFLGMEIEEDSTVHLETRKKEDRNQMTDEMSFQDFLRIYNKTEHYMVDDVPQFLKNDLVFPCAVQCQSLMDNNVVATLMWFSSGGTNSVLHADAVDNINCIYRGDKTFVMVDPNKYRSKVDLDHPEGLYSSVDVDKVDYTKFPGLADVEFYTVNLTAGDCLYIPYRWYHQVRSYGSNLAVNIWWDHHAALDVNIDNCYTGCDSDITLDKVETQGLDSISLSVGSIKDQFINSVAVRSIDIDIFRKTLVGDRVFDEMEPEERKRMMRMYRGITEEFFTLMDTDSDGLVSETDLEKLPDEAWWDAQTFLREIEQILDGEEDEDEDDEDYEHDEL